MKLGCSMIHCGGVNWNKKTLWGQRKKGENPHQPMPSQAQPYQRTTPNASILSLFPPVRISKNKQHVTAHNILHPMLHQHKPPSTIAPEHFHKCHRKKSHNKQQNPLHQTTHTNTHHAPPSSPHHHAREKQLPPRNNGKRMR